MAPMKILLTPPLVGANLRYFPESLLARLRTVGELAVNPTDRPLRRAELIPLLGDVDVVMTHWGSPQYDAALLDAAPKLKIIAHCAGTVAHIASEEAYARGITVLSANAVMARYVAEWVLGAMIAGLRDFPAYDAMMRRGEWRRQTDVTRSLYDTEIGLIGFGAVGRALLDLLRPFGCRAVVYDPYITPDAIAAWNFARPCSFAEAMRCPIVSIHASQTPETRHMINADALAMMPAGGLLINSARGSLVDTEALLDALTSGRIGAVLDVFEREGRRQDERLLACPNVILQPHTAALPAGSRMTEAIVGEIARYAGGEALRMTVTLDQYRRMTQE